MKSSSKKIAWVAGLGIGLISLAALATQGFGYGPGTGPCQQGAYGESYRGFGPGMGRGRMHGYGPMMHQESRFAGPHHRWGGHFGPDDNHHTAELAQLQQSLQLTSEQKAAWQQFETTMNGQHQAMKAIHESMWQQGPQGHFQQMQQARTEHLAVRDQALAELAQTLTIEQQQILDNFKTAHPFQR